MIATPTTFRKAVGLMGEALLVASPIHANCPSTDSTLVLTIKEALVQSALRVNVPLIPKVVYPEVKQMFTDMMHAQSSMIIFRTTN